MMKATRILPAALLGLAGLVSAGSVTPAAASTLPALFPAVSHDPYRKREI